MKIAKDGIRSIVRIGYDGKVYKTFRGTDADKRFANEVKVLEVLENRGCPFVPRVVDTDEDELTLVTTNCGAPVEKLSDKKLKELFEELKQDYGVIHDDPFTRNITYDQRMGRFCVIDFELAEILEREPVGKKLRLFWTGVTKAGKFKGGENQDSLAVFGSVNGAANEYELSGDDTIVDDGIVFAVSDGMGGPGGGQVASSLAVNELRRILPGRLGGFRGAANWLEILEEAVKDLHSYVSRIANSRPGLEYMGATLVCGLFFRKTMYFAHVGDSRLYRFRNGSLDQLTQDHSIVGGYLSAGLINEKEARSHPRRNIIVQAIAGGCGQIAPQMGQAQLEAGDWYIICSDGLIDGMWDHRICDMISEAIDSGQAPKALAQKMLDFAIKEAGRDDTTLFVIQVACDED